ncbi:MAG: lipid II:glycine glycyltransferase FemX [Candidatus Nealsonbacteria bacterium]
MKKIQSKKTWENFLLKCEEKTFLDSWNWGEFNKMMGEKIWRLGVYNNRELFSVALVVKTVAKRGTFLLLPHSPNLKPETGSLKAEILKILLEKLKEIAKASFIRINPILERSEENNEIFKKLGFKPAPIHTHPEASWKLDINPSEEELLMQMRKTTRYLIRQAQRNKDVKIYQSKNIEDIEVFNKLYQEVVNRHHFTPFSLEYLKNEFLAFQPDNQISLFFGKYKGEIVASAFVLFWSNIGFYHHAALLPQYHKIPISYSLLWEAIKEAKKRGCRLYDFWGYVDPKKYPKHPWAGPTLFKMGFGGKPYEYVKTQDFPLSKRYWLTFIFEKIRKAKRRL